MAKKEYRVLKVLNNGLVEVPIWEDHRRARNWCATVMADPNAPGGLRRNFWGQARGQAAEIFKYIIPESVVPCDVVEFGADVMNYGGDRRKTNRWYGVVLARYDRGLYLVPCGGKAVEAFAAVDGVREALAEMHRKAQEAPLAGGQGAPEAGEGSPAASEEASPTDQAAPAVFDGEGGQV